MLATLNWMRSYSYRREMNRLLDSRFFVFTSNNLFCMHFISFYSSNFHHVIIFFSSFCLRFFLLFLRNRLFSVFFRQFSEMRRLQFFDEIWFFAVNYQDVVFDKCWIQISSNEILSLHASCLHQIQQIHSFEWDHFIAYDQYCEFVKLIRVSFY
jgi:hypothetical protein